MSKRFNQKSTRILSILILSLLSATMCQGAIEIQNSSAPVNNDTAFNAWLADIGITAGQLEYLVDFESGFYDGQNVSGAAGLFAGGLVITDTSGTYGAIIRHSSVYFGGSNPIGQFALSHNETPYLQLDFTENPVDYVSFQDIDHTGTSVYVEFTDSTSVIFSIETTGSGGNIAEFTGIYRNDMPRIQRIRLDAGGDGRWGIDNIRYGRIPEPCFVDLQDFNHFAVQWMMAGTPLDADLNISGEVNLADLIMFVEHWLSPCPANWPL